MFRVGGFGVLGLGLGLGEPYDMRDHRGVPALAFGAKGLPCDARLLVLLLLL